MSYCYAIFSALFSPHVGGVESYTENLAKELVAQGNKVVVVTSRLPETEERELYDSGIIVVRLPSKSLLGGRLPISKKNARHKELLKELKEFGINRVIINTRFYEHSLIGLEFAQESGLRALVIEHGSAYLTLGNSVVDFVIRRYEDATTIKVKKFNPIFAGVSATCVQWLKNFKIETNNVVPNAIDARSFRTLSSNRNYRQELGILPTDIVVVFIGRLVPEKGPDLLLEASRSLAFSNVHFVFAGDGPMKNRLREKATENTHFIGNVSREDLSAILQQSDVFCLPTRSEGFSTSLLEAAACGLIPVITKVGGVRELIPNSNYGFVLNSSNPREVVYALQRIINMSSEDRTKMGLQIRERTERQATWKNSVVALEKAFL